MHNSTDCLQLFLYCAELWEIAKKLLGPQLHTSKIYLHWKPYFRLDQTINLFCQALVDTEMFNNGDIHDENNLSLIVQNRLEMKDR